MNVGEILTDYLKIQSHTGGSMSDHRCPECHERFDWRAERYRKCCVRAMQLRLAARCPSDKTLADQGWFKVLMAMNAEGDGTIPADTVITVPPAKRKRRKLSEASASRWWRQAATSQVP
jgi:hypothetical protein